jgi:DNA mismatch endonuclease (patch repair protein)
MAAIRNKNTKPELVVRRLLCAMGLRYRLHRNDLPGKPDIVMPGRKVAIFVHGCFFHMHKCRYGRVVPATNAEFWQIKRSSNASRDGRNARALRKLGWQVFTIWECQTKEPERLSRLLNRIA